MPDLGAREKIVAARWSPRCWCSASCRAPCSTTCDAPGDGRVSSRSAIDEPADAAAARGGATCDRVRRTRHRLGRPRPAHRGARRGRGRRAPRGVRARRGRAANMQLALALAALAGGLARGGRRCGPASRRRGRARWSAAAYLLTLFALGAQAVIAMLALPRRAGGRGPHRHRAGRVRAHGGGRARSVVRGPGPACRAAADRDLPADAVRHRRHAAVPGHGRPHRHVHRARGAVAAAVRAVRDGAPAPAAVAGGGGQVLPARRVRVGAVHLRRRADLRLRRHGAACRDRAWPTGGRRRSGHACCSWLGCCW